MRYFDLKFVKNDVVFRILLSRNSEITTLDVDNKTIQICPSDITVGPHSPQKVFAAVKSTAKCISKEENKDILALTLTEGKEKGNESYCKENIYSLL